MEGSLNTRTQFGKRGVGVCAFSLQKILRQKALFIEPCPQATLRVSSACPTRNKIRNWEEEIWGKRYVDGSAKEAPMHEDFCVLY